MSADTETGIRQRAYEIWEREGRAHGSAIEHWLEAEGEIAAQAGLEKQPEGATQSPTKAAGTAGKKKRASARKATAAPAR